MRARTKKRYIALHKPLDVLCQFTDDGGRGTLADYVDEPGVYAVGRLDADSEGLLLLTDDGVLQHRLAEPRYKQPKTYLVQVEGIPDELACRTLEQGVTVSGTVMRARAARLLESEPSLPPRARPVRYRRNLPTSWMEIILEEGKNRQVRRMTAAAGFPTLRLVRVSIGPIRLGELAPGEWRWLTPDELEELSPLLRR